ncbi:hypothetical protein JR316_0005680 [Psilocybe cubensis]|uniref:CxC5 like cysteine cluster associated with KDZ domain-containing protein n=2 Tax=Psilocybe cubensis TaxID=181762 RepID=A0A8H8CLX0_PSICU|nr:hypothetical protein JR316_0005680 [Psilocybe cubensis]KAH9481160.1 hypothetical protein JR316_0005680 [Psilocybe cubensis]
MSSSSSAYSSSTLQSILQIQASIAKYLDFEGCLKFIELIQLLKPTICLSQQPGLAESDAGEDKCPARLRLNVHTFLAQSLSVDHEAMKIIWRAMANIAWNFRVDESCVHSFGQRHIQCFLDYGRQNGIAFYHLMPPVRHCLDPRCVIKPKTSKKDELHRRPLKEAHSRSVTVFTQSFGPIPGISTSMFCSGCQTRYYPNYWVDRAQSTRTFYRIHRTFLHVTEGIFMDIATLELFTTMMLTSWTSASNCARIYNEAIASKSLSSSLPAAYSKSMVLEHNDVWNGLSLFWLLEDSEEEDEVLQIDHVAPSQAIRLRKALKRRNLWMAGTGQEAWNHVCDLCCWYNDLPDGTQTFLRSVVTDGITIGRPTCSIHDCDIPLDSVKHRFCPTHKDQNLICAVTSCSAPIDEGYQTCSLKDHRALEAYNDIHNKAMFQLKLRLARLKTSQPTDAFSTDDGQSTIFGDEEVLIDANGVCDEKSEKGNQTLRARFGRRRTHNEELCVASCGVILGRATFYGSEAPNGVRTFWKTLFPTQKSLPGVLWHDNNCRIMLMLEKEKDTYFSHSALPVDVFHFKCKHKAQDDKCNANCNPAKWPELMTPDGKWRFNSSAAEQANAWLGGYQAIVREMQADRYEFFLDELIKRRNRNIIKDLEKKGKNPHEIPRDFLLKPDTPRVD